ncbi:TetR/AcrR family transcriptional regulator [Bauldia sp.]|uniref:TetR/AcrR family transcriptional regulator n=1 Tax=Bauldia sp. TaxID=2575872 RepID=UPI003BAD68F9
MTEREIHIIESAFSLFLRYGVKRTNMNDIAKAAGIARQTLYNAFPNKDAVLRATIRLFTDRALAEVEKELRRSETLGDKIDVVFQQLAVRPFEILHVSPNAEDIISGMNAASRDEIAENDRAFRSVLERVFSERKEAIANAGLSPKALAEIAQICASASKDKATDRKHLDDLLAAEKAMILSITGR